MGESLVSKILTDPSDILLQLENAGDSSPPHSNESSVSNHSLIDISILERYMNTSDLENTLFIPIDLLNCGHYHVVGDQIKRTTELTKTCRFWSEGVMSVGVAAFGLIGNIISIWILSASEMKSTSFNRLLMALAVIDSLFIIPGIVIYISKVFGWHPECSMYMTVAIAVERYIGLCRPLRRLAGRPCSAKYYIISVTTLAVLLNIPKFLEAETRVVGLDPLTNSTVSRIKASALRKHPGYITYYWLWTRLLTTGIVPLILLAILNSKIYLAIRQSKHQLRTIAIRSALPMAILGKSVVNDICLESPSPSPNIKRSNHLLSSSPFANINNNKNKNNNGANNINNNFPPLAPVSPIRRTASSFEPIRRTFSRPKEAILRSHSAAATTPVASTSATTTTRSGGSSDLNLAPILFGVVIVFVVCNSLRLILNFYDFTVVEEIIDCERKGVGRFPPPWIVCSVSVSHFLLMVNSSVNFLVYCFAGTKFRTILTRKVNSIWKKYQRDGKKGSSNSPIRNNNRHPLSANNKLLLPPHHTRNNSRNHHRAFLREALIDPKSKIESPC
ncbi:unnamed protein product [Lepeophtheirus salmonis]|uniref:(salmon louse) hypothetical protein n=1 Tax=Lepeophtheirus salmonis TaxID=72036 RepID=A0A7R8H606_LEPSM|nr:unnamed protein product [Lepeophtheirus salmonis]CAF2873018.1 unnamed protein product [Lepeophtheirus salmonis]